MEILHIYTIAVRVLIPVFSAVACGILVGFSYGDCLSRKERSLKGILLAYLFFSALGWYVSYCYQFRPTLFTWLHVACLLSYTLPAILFYRIIRFLTRKGQPERFSPLHFLAPGLLAAAMFVWSLFVPFDVQLEIVRSKAEVFPQGYELYARFFTSKPLLRVIFGIVYYILTIAALIHYFRKATGRDTLVRKPAGWVLFLIGISLASLLSSLLPSFMPRSKIFLSVWTFIVSLSIAAQHVLLSYHILRRKYLLYAIHVREPDDRPKALHRSACRHYSGKISRQRLESYFRHEKPYLKPDYKITDLVEAMDVNRSVLSAFINQTYGVGFSRYLNRWRLRELEQLRAQPANRDKTISALIGQTGFGEYRKYARAAAVEREAATATAKKRWRKKKGDAI